jgi:protein-arginine kinase activator protein McsA
MGNTEEKMQLASVMMGITEKTYKAIFQKYADKCPSIYLISLGTVGALRKTFDIDPTTPDDSVLYKYGFTEDLGRRIGEHETNYGKLENVKLVLTTFHIIDPKYTSDAEGDVRDECNAYEVNLKNNKYRELIILNKKQLEHVKKNYGRLGRDYAGHTAELQKQISALKDEIRDLNFENERLKTLIETKDLLHAAEIRNKDLQLENKNLQLEIYRIR